MLRIQGVPRKTSILYWSQSGTLSPSIRKIPNAFLASIFSSNISCPQRNQSSELGGTGSRTDPHATREEIISDLLWHLALTKILWD